METVFEAENSIEAHMIVHMLERAGIEAQILGEYLQGGVGELAAQGNIRIAVDVADAHKAREIIKAWESEQASVGLMENTEARGSLLLEVVVFFVGVGLASAFFLYIYNTPYGSYTADYNRDGTADEWTYWRGDRLTNVEVDRNFDGTIDASYSYSARNGLDESDFDDDFDGTFETIYNYTFGQPTGSRVDFGGDGTADYRYRFEDGVLTEIDLLDPANGRARKTQFYEHGTRLTEAHWDSDGDGAFDTLIVYGPFEEEVSRSPIERAD